MKQLFPQKTFAIFDFILPGTLSAILIAKCGVMWIGAVIVLEFIQTIILNRIMQIKIHAYDWKKVLLTSVGIVIGGCSYRVKCNPTELYIVVMILTVVIHAAIYLIMSNAIKKR